MKAEIVWTGGAERDLLILFDQILELSGEFDAVLRLLRQPLDHAIELLAENPRLGAPVVGNLCVRRLLLGTRRRYGLFYVEEHRRLMIHALLDMKQDPEIILNRLRRL